MKSTSRKQNKILSKNVQTNSNIKRCFVQSWPEMTLHFLTNCVTHSCKWLIPDNKNQLTLHTLSSGHQEHGAPGKTMTWTLGCVLSAASSGNRPEHNLRTTRGNHIKTKQCDGFYVHCMIVPLFYIYVCVCVSSTMLIDWERSRQHVSASEDDLHLPLIKTWRLFHCASEGISQTVLNLNYQVKYLI